MQPIPSSAAKQLMPNNREYIVAALNKSRSPLLNCFRFNLPRTMRNTMRKGPYSLSNGLCHKLVGVFFYRLLVNWSCKKAQVVYQIPHPGLICSGSYEKKKQQHYINDVTAKISHTAALSQFEWPQRKFPPCHSPTVKALFKITILIC